MQTIEVKRFQCEDCGEQIELGKLDESEAVVLSVWRQHALKHLVIMVGFACGICRTVYVHKKAADTCWE